MYKLPKISPETIEGFLASVKNELIIDKKYNDYYLVDKMRTMNEENPYLAYLVSNSSYAVSEYNPDCALSFMRGCVFVYELLRRQLESNSMEEELSID